MKNKDYQTIGLYEHNIEGAQNQSRVGMRVKNKRMRLSWEEMYKYAKAYYEEHGDLEVPTKFILESDQGPIRLGQWVANQRQTCSPESERGQKLLKIRMRFENKRLSWKEMYKYANEYYMSKSRRF